eukprot:scaffold3028_cov174-Amphora_coffeaeformis.AAC.22
MGSKSAGDYPEYKSVVHCSATLYCPNCNVRMGDKVEFPKMIDVYQGIIDVPMKGWEHTI